MTLIVYAGVFVLTFLALLALLVGVRGGGQTHKTRMALERLESYDSRAFRRAELAQPARERLLVPAFARVSAAGRYITPTGRLRRLQTKVEQGGRPWNLDLNGLLALKVLSLLFGILVLVILASLRWLPATWFLVAAVAIAVVTYYLPDILLHFWVAERKRLISRSIPDFLDLLTVTVEAGLGLESALARITSKIRGPLGEEILITLHHMRIGQSRDIAVRELARRCDVKDLDNFVATLIQSQRLGVSLGHILRTQSKTIRTVRRQRVEEAAQKAPVKLLFPMMFCILPSLFVVILGPAAIRIYNAFAG